MLRIELGERKTKRKIEEVRKKISVSEILCQLAEECAELSKAALKLRRAISRENPTPIDECTAMKNLVEEIADVSLVLKVLGLDHNNHEVCLFIVRITNQKMDRWLERLADKGK